jgi:hypothetical protein
VISLKAIGVWEVAGGVAPSIANIGQPPASVAGQ